KPEAGPQPVAVVRIGDLVGKTLPLPFEIGPADLMVPDQGGTFAGPLALKVKLSHGGDAATSPGDLIGHPAGAADGAPGATGVTLELTEIAGAPGAATTVAKGEKR